MVVVGLLIVWTACIAWYDFRQRRVPNVLLILAAVPALLALIVNGVGLLGERWGSSVGGMALGFALTIPGYALHRFGAGDVKFAAVLGLLLGVGRGFEMVLGASILMGVAALFLLALHRQMQARFPAAPMLGAAFAVEMMWGPLLIR
ncbi:prepilin peptidase [Solimonas flava]|uniref:prepilin peptidase n=1 Tax=Solimonas flava TaxID=415849 RepID=UPI000686A03E|nr:prepilin peptidase [Solimonas flava]